MLAHRVMDALMETFFDDMLCFKEIDDEDALKSIETGFNKLTRNTVIGCVGAILPIMTCAYLSRELDLPSSQLHAYSTVI